MLKLTDDLIKEYEKYVYSIINKYSTKSNRDDLMQVGMLGILNASQKYDSNQDVKFTTFAYKYVLGEVLKYLREDRNIKIGRELYSDYKKIMMAKDHIYKSYGRLLSTSELSKIIGIDEQKINEALMIYNNEVSLYKEINSDDKKLTIEDTLYNNEKIIDNNYLDLKNAMNNLNKEERVLLYKRYYQNMTQSEIAKETNTSQVKVYRYERKILDKLKDKMS